MLSARPTPAFIARALAGVQKAGHAPVSIEIRQDGSIFVALQPPVATPPEAPLKNKDVDECDRLFENL